MDGNKRAGVFAAARLLDLAGYEFGATNEDLVRLALRVAEGRVEVEEISRWFAEHTTAKE